MDTRPYGYSFVWPGDATKLLGGASEIYCRIRFRGNINGNDSIAGLPVDQGLWPLSINKGGRLGGSGGPGG